MTGSPGLAGKGPVLERYPDFGELTARPPDDAAFARLHFGDSALN